VRFLIARSVDKEMPSGRGSGAKTALKMTIRTQPEPPGVRRFA
jgi:hypothetical protein